VEVFANASCHGSWQEVGGEVVSYEDTSCIANYLTTIKNKCAEYSAAFDSRQEKWDNNIRISGNIKVPDINGKGQYMWFGIQPKAYVLEECPGFGEEQRLVCNVTRASPYQVSCGHA